MAAGVHEGARVQEGEGAGVKKEGAGVHEGVGCRSTQHVLYSGMLYTPVPAKRCDYTLPSVLCLHSVLVRNKSWGGPRLTVLLLILAVSDVYIEGNNQLFFQSKMTFKDVS